MSTTQTVTEFKSSQGQRAGALRLRFDEMTPNEQLLVVCLAKEGRPVMTIKEIMVELGWHLGRAGKARGNSRVRNTLRRLVRSRWVTHDKEVGDGRYRLTSHALLRLRKVVDEVAASKPAPKTEPAPAQTVAPVTPADDLEF